VRQPVAFLVEMLAQSQRRVRLWGVFVLIPFLRSYVVPPLKAVLGGRRSSRACSTATRCSRAGSSWQS